MINQHTFTFLTGLAGFNDKKFFNLNIDLYKAIQKDFVKFWASLIKKISEFDDSIIGTEVKQCTFRINRDTRFSNNKTPYKTNLWIFIAPWWKKSIFPWYYVHIEPSKSFFWWWIYYPSTENAYKIRTYIYENYKDFEWVLNNKEFKSAFKWVYTFQDSLKKTPKWFDPNHPWIKYIQYKDWLAGNINFKDNEVITENFEDKVVEYCKKLYILNKFLHKALI